MTTEIGDYVNIPDSDDAKAIADVIRDIDNSLMMIQSKQDYIKEAKKALKEAYELTPQSIALMIKLYHKQDAPKHFAQQEEMQSLYDKLFPIKENDNGGAQS